MLPSKTTCLIATALIASVSPAHAQQKNDETFWETRPRQEAAAAAQMVLADNPLTALVLRSEGLRWKVWSEPEFLGDAVPALDADLLDLVRDGTAMPDFRSMAPDEKRADQIAIYKIWTQAVVNAFTTPADAFSKSAAENSHVTFAHLWNTPERYRGKVIPIQGRLARLRKNDATLAAQKQGVRYVYEGWIFGPTERSRPFWVLFPNLPDGLKEAETMDRKVSFNGYFIKRMPYPSADGTHMLEAPMLIGPTLVLAKELPAASPAPPLSMAMVAGVMIVIAAAGVGLVLLSWYFHRGDQAMRQRLARLQADHTANLFDHADTEETDFPSRDEFPSRDR